MTCISVSWSMTMVAACVRLNASGCVSFIVMLPVPVALGRELSE